ncbi:MAG: VOC family protein [Candidatus Cyclobacteriaceae bacterium M3_2C_046]
MGNCAQAVEFYQKSFGLGLKAPVMFAPDGKKVMHAMLSLGDTNLMMADVFGGN